jgi:hypothetical protein
MDALFPTRWRPPGSTIIADERLFDLAGELPGEMKIGIALGSQVAIRADRARGCH